MAVYLKYDVVRSWSSLPLPLRGENQKITGRYDPLFFITTKIKTLQPRKRHVFLHGELAKVFFTRNHLQIIDRCSCYLVQVLYGTRSTYCCLTLLRFWSVTTRQKTNRPAREVIIDYSPRQTHQLNFFLAVYRYFGFPRCTRLVILTGALMSNRVYCIVQLHNSRQYVNSNDYFKAFCVETQSKGNWES